MTNAERLREAWSGMSRRAAIFEYPVREMQARGWIADTNNTDELEREMRRFFSVNNLRDVTMENFSDRRDK